MVDIVILADAVLKMDIITNRSKDILFSDVLGDKERNITLDGIL